VPDCEEILLPTCQFEGGSLPQKVGLENKFPIESA
jgi:hypothetical protein